MALSGFARFGDMAQQTGRLLAAGAVMGFARHAWLRIKPVRLP
ncbi:MAG: hypothetical protein R3A44_18370 [Caldilineaceae bacterium]